eukprot:Awhi_evm2s334
MFEKLDRLPSISHLLSKRLLFVVVFGLWIFYYAFVSRTLKLFLFEEANKNLYKIINITKNNGYSFNTLEKTSNLDPYAEKKEKIEDLYGFFDKGGDNEPFLPDTTLTFENNNTDKIEVVNFINSTYDKNIGDEIETNNVGVNSSSAVSVSKEHTSTHFEHPIFTVDDHPNRHIEIQALNTDFDLETLSTKYFCPPETARNLQSPPCWFENICYINNEFITFGKEASHFHSTTTAIGKYSYEFQATNYKKFTDLPNYQEYEFDGVVTYLLYRPIKNFFFSIMQFAGLLATVEHHQKNMTDTNRRYILLKDKRDKWPNFSAVHTWQQFFDPNPNSNLPLRETLEQLNGKCLRKVVIGDKGQLAAAVAKGVGREKKSFYKGTKYMIQRFVNYTTKILNYDGIDPRLPNSYNHAHVGKFKFNKDNLRVGPSYRPLALQTVSSLANETTNTKPLAVIMKRTGGKRAIRNLKDITNLVRSYGFKTKTIDYSILSVYEQITLSRSAALFIGVHGAGLANLLWLRPKVSVMIEIFPFNFAKFTYQALALVNDVNYDYWKNDKI